MRIRWGIFGRACLATSRLRLAAVPTLSKAAHSSIKALAALQSNYSGILRGVLAQNAWHDISAHLDSVIGALKVQRAVDIGGSLFKWDLFKHDMTVEQALHLRFAFQGAVYAARQGGNLEPVAKGVVQLLDAIAVHVDSIKEQLVDNLTQALSGLSTEGPSFEAPASHNTGQIKCLADFVDWVSKFIEPMEMLCLSKVGNPQVALGSASEGVQHCMMLLEMPESAKRIAEEMSAKNTLLQQVAFGFSSLAMQMDKLLLEPGSSTLSAFEFFKQKYDLSREVAPKLAQSISDYKVDIVSQRLQLFCSRLPMPRCGSRGGTATRCEDQDLRFLAGAGVVFQF
jgi:hypothetical protein